MTFVTFVSANELKRGFEVSLVENGSEKTAKVLAVFRLASVVFIYTTDPDNNDDCSYLSFVSNAHDQIEAADPDCGDGQDAFFDSRNAHEILCDFEAHVQRALDHVNDNASSCSSCSELELHSFSAT